MRRSPGDALKNASKDEKCEPIDRFQSFKWRNRVQDQNLHKKLSKIGHFGNFDFWSKVNAISQNQWLAWSMVYTTRVGSRLSGSGHKLGYKAAEIMMYQWHGLRLTWQDDFIGWCQSRCQRVFLRMYGVWRRQRMTGIPSGAYRHVQRQMTFGFHRFVDRWMSRPIGRHVQ